jgi:hypothetical protein
MLKIYISYFFIYTYTIRVYKLFIHIPTYISLFLYQPTNSMEVHSPEL